MSWDKALHIINRVYLFFAGFRNFLYDVNLLKSIEERQLPVISVGNISWVGTGKSEVVKLVAKRAILLNKRPVVVSRGYKCDVNYAEIKFDFKGNCDEPLMIKKALPGAYVFVGKKREKVISMCKSKYIDVECVVLDDGFQYRRLKRDLDIVLVKPGQRFFREGFSSLKRAGIVVISKVRQEEEAFELKKEVSKYTDADIVAMRYRNVFPKVDKNVIVVCGIENGKGFVNATLASNFNVIDAYTFKDHYWYVKKDVLRIVDDARRNDSVIFTTPKDYVKLNRFADVFKKNNVALEVIEPKIEFLWGEVAFWEIVEKAIRKNEYGA